MVNQFYNLTFVYSNAVRMHNKSCIELKMYSPPGYETVASILMTYSHAAFSFCQINKRASK